MLGKESVRSRLDSGISYTEFTYMILQAYDFLHLNREYGCILQAGGSDQWGNITAGVDLIRRVSAKKAYGLTLPLVTQSGGKKLGKTEGGAIWLDAERTTPYQLYQYWIGVNDLDVIRFLKYFTFLSADELTNLHEEVRERPGAREAQRTLAREVTALVHGKKEMQRAENISNALFYARVSDLTVAEIEAGLHDVPTYTLVGDRDVSLVDLLVEARISPSKRRAREDIRNNAITVNDVRRNDINVTLTTSERIGGKYIIIRRGKNAYFLIDWPG
jgi:tyrosyl-tRNA synthetase